VTDDPASGPNPVTLLFRQVLRQRLQTLVAPRARVAEVGALGLAPARDLDGAVSGPGVLQDADLAALGRSLAAALRPGAPVLLCLGAGGAPRIDLGAAKERLGPDLVWHRAFALGVIVPATSRQEWVRRHPQAFGLLAAAERLVRTWPVLRARGEYIVIEGARR
jgi:hypothetical protein